MIGNILRSPLGFDNSRPILACPVCDCTNVHRKYRNVRPDGSNRYFCQKCRWEGCTPVKRLRKTPYGRPVRFQDTKLKPAEGSGNGVSGL